MRTAVAGVLVALLAGACTTAAEQPAGTAPTGATPAPGASPTGPARASASPTGAPVTAQELLATLPVKGRAPLTGYDRGSFEYGDADLNDDGCDTRNEILLRDLDDVTMRPAGCLVATGTLADPYSGRTIAFVRGVGTSSDVQIDHVVALADAWQKGAQRWDAATRARFGNDPLNLLAVDGPLNQSKGAGDAATWLPPHKPYRCAYVARQVTVKREYGLWVTTAERYAMARVLSTCPDEPLPDASSNGWSGSQSGPSSGPPPGPSEAPTDEPTSGSSGTFFENCTAAREAGAAPLHRGEPGYRSSMDGDGDGIACE